MIGMVSIFMGEIEGIMEPLMVSESAKLAPILEVKIYMRMVIYSMCHGFDVIAVMGLFREGLEK